MSELEITNPGRAVVRRVLTTLALAVAALGPALAAPAAMAGPVPGLDPVAQPIPPVAVSVRTGAVADPTIRLFIEAVGRTDTSTRIQACLVYVIAPVACRTRVVPVGQTITIAQRALTGGRISPLIPVGGTVRIQAEPQPVYNPFALQTMSESFTLKYQL